MLRLSSCQPSAPCTWPRGEESPRAEAGRPPGSPWLLGFETNDSVQTEWWMDAVIGRAVSQALRTGNAEGDSLCQTPPPVNVGVWVCSIQRTLRPPNRPAQFSRTDQQLPGVASCRPKARARTGSWPPASPIENVRRRRAPSFLSRPSLDLPLHSFSPRGTQTKPSGWKGPVVSTQPLSGVLCLCPPIPLLTGPDSASLPPAAALIGAGDSVWETWQGFSQSGAGSFSSSTAVKLRGVFLPARTLLIYPKSPGILSSLGNTADQGFLLLHWRWPLGIVASPLCTYLPVSTTGFLQIIQLVIGFV